jgi:hypothetical protein
MSQYPVFKEHSVHQKQATANLAIWPTYSAPHGLLLLTPPFFTCERISTLTLLLAEIVMATWHGLTDIAGREHGPGEEIHEDGRRFEGECVNGKRQGR